MKAFVIYLPTHKHSVDHSARMVSQLKAYGLDAYLWAGTPGNLAVSMAQQDQRTAYPFSIKTTELREENLRPYIRPELWEEFQHHHYWTVVRRHPLGNDLNKVNQPGVIGCFYSHYNLWRKCMEIDEPIMIFEDDVIFFREWHPIEWKDILILSLGKSSFLNEPWKSYLENPSGMPQAINWVNYSMPGASGYAIKPKAARRLVKFYHRYYYAADNAINKSICDLQIHNYIMGRNSLPEEGNVSMTRTKEWAWK